MCTNKKCLYLIEVYAPRHEDSYNQGQSRDYGMADFIAVRSVLLEHRSCGVSETFLLQLTNTQDVQNKVLNFRRPV